MKNILRTCLVVIFWSHLLLADANMQIIDLSSFEKKVTSQNGEDGVIEAIFSFIGAETKYFVEFGTQNGDECNMRYLREQHQWRGLMMDGGHENLEINLRKEFITAENINDLFVKYNVPTNLDLLSIDVDYNDFHIWKAVDSRYRPKVVVIEYNAIHGATIDAVVPYGPTLGWDGTSHYFGASINALAQLGRTKGYTLIYAEKRGVNLFFLRDDIVAALASRGISFQNTGDVERLYKPPSYTVGPNHPTKNSYLTAADLLITIGSNSTE